MWKKILINNVIPRLKKPSTILSLVSQGTTILLILGFNVNEYIILAIATGICSIFVTLGILSNPDTENKGYGDDILFCSKDNKYACHVKINGQMLCKECGCIYAEQSEYK